MTDGTGMPDSAEALHTTHLVTLLAELTRLVGEVEQMVTGAHHGPSGNAADLAAQQDAIVAAAHEEAAAVLAAAHSAAARVLDRASRGQRTPEAASAAVPRPAGSVLDLRDATPTTTPVDLAPHAAPAPPPPATEDDLDGDMRASIAAAIDMARGLSQRIEQLSQDLHDSPAP